MVTSYSWGAGNRRNETRFDASEPAGVDDVPQNHSDNQRPERPCHGPGRERIALAKLDIGRTVTRGLNVPKVNIRIVHLDKGQLVNGLLCFDAREHQDTIPNKEPIFGAVASICCALAASACANLARHSCCALASASIAPRRSWRRLSVSACSRFDSASTAGGGAICCASSNSSRRFQRAISSRLKCFMGLAPIKRAAYCGAYCRSRPGGRRRGSPHAARRAADRSASAVALHRGRSALHHGGMGALQVRESITSALEVFRQKDVGNGVLHICAFHALQHIVLNDHSDCLVDVRRVLCSMLLGGAQVLLGGALLLIGVYLRFRDRGAVPCRQPRRNAGRIGDHIGVEFLQL